MPPGISQVAPAGSGRGWGRGRAGTLIGATATAKEVAALGRRLTVDGDVLRYTTAMEAVGVAIQEHLSGELRRSL
jgi:hypothetical protein